MHSTSLPKVSIVTPSFRQLDWLRLAVQSVADQQSVVFEHIIQDAGSPGITEFAQSCSATVFVERDGGMYDAINRGLSKTTGEICAWLNCDEQYLPGTLERVAQFFSAHAKIDILFGDTLIVNSTGEALAYRQGILPSKHHIRSSHLNTNSCATFFRRRVFEVGNNLPTEFKSIGDAIWIYRLLDAGVQAAVCNQLMSVFTLTGENLSTHNPVSNREKELWFAEEGAPSRFMRPWHIGIHRMRKLLAGAYRKRSFDYQIYTRESPANRVRFHATNVGGVWVESR